jgi:hypothetical protein
MFDSWPFDPQEPEDVNRWWETCFYLNPVAQTLLQHPYWSVLFGGPLSGKSSVLAWVRRQQAETALIVDYPPQKWPKPNDPPEINHLSRMMRLAAEQIRDWIMAQPDRLANLTESQDELLRWLLEKFIHPRAYIRMVDALPPALDADLRRVPFTDLYPTQVDGGDVEGQINELVTLVRRLGKERIIFFIDINGMLRVQQVDQLEALFKWQALKHQDGFQGILALSEMDKRQAEWIELARRRIKPFMLKQNEEQSLAIADRFVALATRGAVERLQDLLTPDQFSWLTQLVQVEFEGQPAGAWVKLAHLLLEQLTSVNQPLQAPEFETLCRNFYCRHLKLYVNLKSDRCGVWRGSRFIPLDPGPYSLVKKMVEKKGEPVFNTDIKEKKVNKMNMHTLVHRIREKIEPELGEENQTQPGQSKQEPAPIYVINKKSYGYWLEHFVDLSVLEEDL